ncbi:hypothetical protein [Rossellomorea sp. BNER]|uniref:hypothetical protein n=1 Tax=Rossellomorea sp. BNER TaxID=2962031 RepID=UPI003AF2A62B|nr:hypothetical protein [Rossellomorea sp. BNER]
MEEAHKRGNAYKRKSGLKNRWKWSTRAECRLINEWKRHIKRGNAHKRKSRLKNRWKWSTRAECRLINEWKRRIKEGMLIKGKVGSKTVGNGAQKPSVGS